MRWTPARRKRSAAAVRWLEFLTSRLDDRAPVCEMYRKHGIEVWEITADGSATSLSGVTVVDPQTVAIKLTSARFNSRFDREARAISSLNHPNICALYDVGRENGNDYLVIDSRDLPAGITPAQAGRMARLAGAAGTSP